MALNLWLYLRWCVVAKALMRACVVLPIHPVEGRNFHVDDITPSAGMDELVLVGAIDIVS